MNEANILTEEATTLEERSIGERMKEAFADIDMKSAMRLIFNKCPACATPLVRGRWLRFCPDRTCQGYSGTLNKALGNKIDHVKPRTDLEEKALRRLAEQYGVDTGRA